MQPKDKKLVSDDTKNTNSHKKSKDKYKNLLADYPNLWESRSQDDFDHAFAMADEYKRFLDSGKTEREFVSMSIESVEQLGYIDISTLSSL
jgi:hypothetical protein